VLDEPTVGLHPADIDRLASALEELRDAGNTVLVVEHDEELMRRADHIVDMGPGAGRLGGTVVVQGTPAEVAAHADSLTGKALRGELAPPRPSRSAGAPADPAGPVGVSGATGNNLRNASMQARFGEITGVCGPSGSGKSTLVLDTLVPALEGERPNGRWKRAQGGGGGRRVVVVDASPLGRTPASVPATAVGLMDPLRELYARTPDARVRGFAPSHFSFNSPRGRCPSCEGKGYQLVEMQFLADLWLTCEECDGKRYNPEVLEVRYRGHSIADVLELPADQAAETFAHLPAIAGVLNVMCDVGLGYMSLGQSSTTLSAGEAQRVKLAAELLRARDGAKTIVVLDEPSTGLHASDVLHLARVLRRLADRGDAVVLIEHHTGLLCACDRLVELGPGGGADGGRVVAEGTPDELAANPDSPTGPWLAAPQAALPAAGRQKGAAKAVGKSAAKRGKQVAS
jgi:excinuclease ABC subunit A